ncbi:MAG: ABC-type sugar transport system, periplasmic component [Bacilli bacterium]|nr:ABC-type sugar transport system, periplasmic component [Bacilli bacterium]
MKNKLKWIAPAALVLLTVGCGSPNAGTNVSGNGTGDSSNNQPVTLRFAWWGTQPRVDLTTKVIDMYEKLHPNVTIQPEYSSWDGYFQKMNAEAAGNNLPDILTQNFDNNLGSYASQNLMANLKPYTDSKKIDTTKISPSLLQDGTVNGQLYAIPIAINALTVLYNEDLLKQAGLQDPSNSWTWDDLATMSQTVHQKLGIYGLRTLDASVLPTFYFRQNSELFYSKDGKSLGFQAQTLVNYWKYNLALIKNGASPNLDYVQQITSTGLSSEPMNLGKAAFDIRWSNQASGMSNGGKETIKLAPLPGPNADQGMYLKPASLLSISKSSKHPDQAADFINFFINNIDAGKILGTERGIPVSSDVRTAVKPTITNPIDQATFDYVDYVTGHSTAADQVFPSKGAQVQQALIDENEKVLYSTETPEQGAQNFINKANTLLKQ